MPRPTDRTCMPEQDVSFQALAAHFRSRLDTVDLDCECRERINDRLAVALSERAREEFSQALKQAREVRAAILRLTSFLDEVDELGIEESDASAFAEAAGIFDDISDTAASGSAALRRAAALRPAISLP